MKKRFNRASLYLSLAMAAAALLIGSLAKAQTAATATTSPAQPAAAKVQTAREASTGMATGRREAPAAATNGTAAATSGTASHEVVEYKDPEDMTTRYRPGNNKVGSLPATPPTSAAADAEAKKHIANIKWQAARQAGSAPLLDAGAKDAAKSTVALDGASKDAAKITSVPKQDAQDAARVNKVEAISIKQ